MMKIVFKNLEKSELAREITQQKLEGLYEQFPALLQHKFVITLSMENSPTQAGPDQFSVTCRIDGPKFQNVQVIHREQNLYLALAKIGEKLAYRLSEVSKSEIRKKRKMARKGKQWKLTEYRLIS